MPELAFSCVDVASDRYAAGPTLVFRLRITEGTGERVHALALRCQFRIEPQKRRYAPVEADRLSDLFGDTSRWADTLKPMQFATAAVMVPSFTDDVEVDVEVPCTYDLDVASTTYFRALTDGEIPLLLLFSGTVITRGETGFSVAPVPWHLEARYALPVHEWRAMMEHFFGDSGWLRLSRSTLDALGALKRARALPTWESAITAVLEDAARPAGLAP